MICFCEVGEVVNSLEAEHVKALQETTLLAWVSFGAAAEHVEFLHTQGNPYMTAYLRNRVSCLDYHILSNLYEAKGLSSHSSALFGNASWCGR